ncbi:MAG: cytochrome c oxidase subunit I [Acidimicrobiales bacterium]
MAVETSHASGLQPPADYPVDREGKSRLSVVTGLIGMIVGFVIGHYVGVAIAGNYPQVQASGQNDVAVILGFIFATVGWLAGLGVLNYPVAKLVGIELPEPEPVAGVGRYFRYTLDHKVVGIQYFVGTLTFFFIAGFFAMMIRTELLSPTYHIWGPGTYIQIVGEHGALMMMMASSLILGPFGNYLVPLLIGARRMAFPRLEALSFWIFMMGLWVMLTVPALGGFPTGWTGYAPLQEQAKSGMDGYLFGFVLVGTAMILLGFNLAATIISYRAPGLKWSRLPIFIWGVFATAMILITATPVLATGCYWGILDRTAQTAFFVDAHGGSSYLWENVFWFFGHPEVYIMALPGFGVVQEMLPVFTRKPLFAYRVGAAGMIGVATVSYFVWQHHLFVSGINPDMRPLFMFTTEIISIPTGFIYLVAMGTLWKAKIRYDVPMLFALSLFFNFLIGGLTGVFNSDVPYDVTIHGSFFVMAHFHYTIMGGLVFAFFGGFYYWMPKITGKMLNTGLSKLHFWVMFLAFNSTFFPLFAVGMLGQPRRVFEYAARLQGLNDWVSISAYVLGFSMLIFLFNVVYSFIISPVAAPDNPWHSRSIEWQMPRPIPRWNFNKLPVFLSHPYGYGDPDALPTANLDGALAAGVHGTTAAVLPAGGE